MSRSALRALVLVIAGAALAQPSPGSTYEFSLITGKAAALGGAFIAQADDPSAVFYNVGALALLEDKPEFTAGLSVVSNGQSLFQGLSPGIAAGFNGEQSTIETPRPHGFMVKKLGKRFAVGGGVYSPFLIRTEWANADTFPGRAIAVATEINSFDASANIGVKIIEGLGFGVGVIYRTSEFSLIRRVQAQNPLTGTVADIATFDIGTPFDSGIGWTAGAVYHFLERFSVGATYRSDIDIDYSGTGRLTQIETGDQIFDDLIRAANPFDRDLGMGTSFSFPTQLGFGVAFAVTKQIKVEIDLNDTEWSRFETLDLRFPGRPLLSDVIRADFVDTSTIRGGVRFRRKSGSEYRAGIAVAESPVPAQTLGPLFPDADSTSFGFGYGKDFLDLAFVWTEYDGRSSRGTVLDFNGNYASNAWVLSMSVSK